MKSSLTMEWVSWAAECVALKVAPATIVSTMVAAGMAEPDIAVMLAKIKQLPGYTALERMTQRYTEAQQQLDALKAGVGGPPIFPTLRANNKVSITVDGHTVGIQATFETPNIVLFSNFLSEAERSVLIAAATPKLLPSEGIAHDTGGNMLTPDRASYGTSFRREETDVIKRIEHRIATILNVPVTYGEGLQVLRYAVGQKYTPHYDYFVDAAKDTRVGGQRVGTVLMYLNTPEAGGATTFPNLGLDIQPVAGNAVFFGYPEAPDVSTLHGGNPVIAGEKWVATKWLRAKHLA